MEEEREKTHRANKKWNTQEWIGWNNTKRERGTRKETEENGEENGIEQNKNNANKRKIKTE